MPAINPNDSFNRTPQPDANQTPASSVNPEDAEAFEGLIEQGKNQNPEDPLEETGKTGSSNQKGSSLFDGFELDPNRQHESFFDDFVVDPTRKPDTDLDIKTDDKPAPKDDQIDIDNFEPEKPDVPKPEEKKSGFWDSLWGGVKDAGKAIGDFITSPDFAKFARVANTVFAGAMVATAAVLFATGVGAPAAIAALALAGGAGLAMQIPAVHDKLMAGVVALMEPILGKELAEKLGPIVTQGLIGGLMIAMVVTGGQAGSAQGALNAITGVFKSMGNFFNTASQMFNAASPVLQMFGVNLDATALAQAGSMFGILGGLMPDLQKFAEGMGQSLKDFLLNPDMAKFGEFLKTVTNLPESIASLMDADFLKGLGSLLSTGEQFLTDFNSNDFMKNFAGLIQLLSQGANLAKA